MKNLCDPMVLDINSGLKFIKDHVCGTCYGRLQMVGPRDEYKIKCFKCNKLLREGEAITNGQLDQIKQSEWIGKHEMRDENEPRMSTEQALKDLGF